MEDDHSNLETSSDTDADLSPETEHNMAIQMPTL